MVELEVLREWRIATNILAEAFREKYYPDETFWHWAGDEVGDVFFIGDYSYNDLGRMRKALELDATREQVEDYFDLELECYQIDESKPELNFENYVKSKKVTT